jgi:integrase
MLRRFAGTFQNTAVSELAKGHLDAFIGSLSNLKSKRNGKPAASAKSRNHHRAVIRQFLGWSVRNDLLSATHRLNEADGMRAENGESAEILFYTPAELKALLDAAEGPMRAMIAIGGLAGLRTQELLRLTWEDVRRVENHIEVTSGKAKTRQRRLVEVVPALAQWLAPYAEFTGKVWTLHEITFQQHFVDLCASAQMTVKGKKDKVAVVRKPNGLRHSFCTYHFAQHGNENLTAQQAGNSPAMLHRNYKGLATKAEGERWFAASPEHPANVVGMGKAAK